ncbi:MAG: peptidylprolyl isomerase [Nitrospirae bacterium]|nr:peptidylprolyl isomerase [Magnetococcales bacterium]
MATVTGGWRGGRCVRGMGVLFMLVLGAGILTFGASLTWAQPLTEKSLKVTSDKASKRMVSEPDADKVPAQLLSEPFVRAGTLDKIAAIVEAQVISDQPVQPKIITQSEVDELIRPAMEEMRKKGEDFDLEALRKRGLEELIVRKLRDQKAAQLGVTVTDEDVDEIIAQVERKNNLPQGGLPAALRRDGIDYDRYRLQLNDQLLENRLQKRIIAPLVTVTDEELRILFNQTPTDQTREEEVHLGQILLDIPAGSSADAVEQLQEKASKLVASLREGKSLSSLASQYSIDPSGLKGGDVGWFKKGELPEKLEGVVFHMQKGEISEPLRSPDGFHIFKMIERRSKEVSQDAQPARYRYKARHILVKVNENRSEAEALEKIKEYREKIRKGTPFAQLAGEVSEDEGSAKDGGSLGWFEQGVMVEAFDNAMNTLKKGEVGEPVRTGFGWHLILLEDKESLSPNSFEAQKSMLEQRLMGTKIKDRYKQWLRDLRLRAFVEFP